jgi:hypothetical protein
MTLTILNGGNDHKPHKPGQVAPPSATMRRYRNDLTAATRNIAANREHSHVTNLRHQHAQAIAAGHPSAPPYDRTLDPDVPRLPLLQATALSVLVQSVLVPGSVPRPQQVEAATIIQSWFGVDRDDAPAHGYPRPVTS